MADDGKVVIGTKLDSNGAVNGMKSLGRTIGKVGGAVLKGTAVALGAVATGIGAIGVSAIKYNADMEQYLTSFEVMTGSAEKAADVMKEVKDIAAKTPFETTDIVKATQNLMAFGFSADEALASFQTLGDLSQGDAQKLESYTLALGKMESSQKVTLESLNLMIENGFNPLQVISEKTGESMASLYDRVSKGTVSIDEIKQAMTDATSEGGKFYKSMDKQSETLAGRLSTLKDGWNEFTGAVFADASNGLATTVLPLLTAYLERLSNAFTKGGISGLVEELGLVFADLSGKIVEALPSILNVASDIITNLIQSLANNMPALIPQVLDILFLIVDTIVTNLPIIAKAGLDLLMGLMDGLARNLPTILPQIIEMIETIGRMIAEQLPLFTQLVVIIMTQIANALIKNQDVAIESMQIIILALIDVIFQLIPLMLIAAAELMKTLIAEIQQAAPKLLTAGIEIAKGFWNGLKQYWGTMLSVPKKLLDDVVKAIQNQAKQFFNAGVDIARAIIDGFKSKIDEITGKISEIKDSISNAVSNFDPLSSVKTAVKNGANAIGINYNVQSAKAQAQAIQTSVNSVPQQTNVLIQGDMAKIFSAVVSTNNGYARGGYSPLVTA